MAVRAGPRKHVASRAQCREAGHPESSTAKEFLTTRNGPTPTLRHEVYMSGGSRARTAAFRVGCFLHLRLRGWVLRASLFQQRLQTCEPHTPGRLRGLRLVGIRELLVGDR